ncbi:circularly permuted type 2 ATP-grasp protein [Sinirhodobacter sp. WL0062]|uniref:Circularly permuted type 2 ATP-grasp protein n=1 Tax=Rhodobacter flavimaris TaxID=2907145 RepID=A0ABS8YVP8_9RHOB|nr:circularly permuted type 2 ATP-grasp protein [Sinirhodobacter sp. WL0062]MCE5972801.1 circularly permuted type 2 ATP-grasp protein [Sinirhodobacter sp. WL0062]
MAETAQHSEAPDLFAEYRLTPGVADELFDAHGQMRPVWRRFVDRFARLSPEDIAARFERGNQYLRDAGVFFRQYSNDPLTEREWPLSHIPVILHEDEWERICTGLSQRADLLEQVLADLYGPARLVSEGHLPAELVAGSRQWLRPMVGVPPRGGHYLHFLAFEIGRSPDGSWFVLGDRTQAPSGAGFALENRMATGRIFPERFPRAHIHRLAGFFGAFRTSMERLAHGQGRARASAILTPGPSNDTYYEHTYIARYLGIPLLEGEDLLVQNGQAMVRTIEGPQPLGVLWRRIDAAFADPLELDSGSQIGTPGIMEAIRQGNLAMVNALGSGVLEMRAMMAFLPRISEVMTGKPLAMPNIATWWCGGAQEQSYVRENAARMLVDSAYACDLPFDLGSQAAIGGAFRSQSRQNLSDWLAADGHRLVGQEAVTLSTTPAWVEDGEDGHGRVLPRPMTVRVFAARTPQGWIFMKGGYARIGRSGDTTALAMQRGGSVADVWVVSDRQVPQETLIPRETDVALRAAPGILPARSADNLYWLGRYVERTEDTIRMVRAYHLRLASTDKPNDPSLREIARFVARNGVDLRDPIPDALINNIESARSCASKVRDRFSTDGWSALGDLARTARAMRKTAKPGDDAARAMSVLVRKITGFSGLVHENMYRFSGWRFLSFGRALERADSLAAMLGAFANPKAPPGSLDIAVEVADSVITHQRRYRIETTRCTAVDLLALDGDNPRAILFQIERIRRLASELPHASDNGRLAELSRAIVPIEAALSVATPTEITSAKLDELRAGFSQISDLLTSAYLR